MIRIRKKNIVCNSLNTDCDVFGTDEDEGLEGGGGAVEGASAPLLASPVQDCVIYQREKDFIVYFFFF